MIRFRVVIWRMILDTQWTDGLGLDVQDVWQHRHSHIQDVWQQFPCLATTHVLYVRVRMLPYVLYVRVLSFFIWEFAVHFVSVKAFSSCLWLCCLVSVIGICVLIKTRKCYDAHFSAHVVLGLLCLRHHTWRWWSLDCWDVTAIAQRCRLDHTFVPWCKGCFTNDSI